MRKSIFTKGAKLTFLISTVTAFMIIPLMANAGTENSSMQQVYTSVEGNIKYYVKPGEKVKKGDPLFFVLCSDNNPALFFENENNVKYYSILYSRRKKLVKTHAVAQEDVDSSLHDLIKAQNELASYLCKVKQGYYVAPYDCEIVKILYPQGSGIGDGNPAINIKPTDKNYKFESFKPNKVMLGLVKRSDELTQKRFNGLNVDELGL
ncbi:MAG TPA: hypothetical protein QF753_12765 [Victivallales bacterium]|nr:hypothetical protein [Victivallales bacterium]